MSIEIDDIDDARLLSLAKQFVSYLQARVSQGLVINVGVGRASTEDEGTRPRRGKKKRKTRTRISEEKVLEVLKERGPQRVQQLVEVLGITQSSVHKKVKELKKAGHVKRVREGANVLWKAVRDGRGRTTAAPVAKKRKATKKVGKRSKVTADASVAV